MTQGCGCSTANRRRRGAPTTDTRWQNEGGTRDDGNREQKGRMQSGREKLLGCDGCSVCTGLDGGWYFSSGSGISFGGCSFKMGVGKTCLLLGKKGGG
ncbi:hypothetical protein HN51_037516 [Arachis hypogaea]